MLNHAKNSAITPKPHKKIFNSSKMFLLGKNLTRLLPAQTIACVVFACILWVCAYEYFAITYSHRMVGYIFGMKENLALIPLYYLAWFTIPIAAFCILWKRNKPFPPSKFLVFYTMLFLCMGSIYIYLINPEIVSDFKSMLDYAIQHAHYNFSPIQDFHEQRSLLILYPLVKLFGNNLLVFKIANLFMLLGIALLGHNILKTFMGYREAQAFMLIWLLSFEPFMTIVIPSHDLWGLFFIIIGLKIFSQLILAIEQSHKAKLIGLMCVVGFISSIIEMQRNTGLMFLVAVLLVTVYHCVQSRSKLYIALLIIPVTFASFSMTNYALRNSGVLVSSAALENARLQMIACHAPSFSSGRFGFCYLFANSFKLNFPDKQSVDLAHSLLLSDLINQPIKQRIDNVSMRLFHLALVGSQRNFYLLKVQNPEYTFSRFAVPLSAFIIFPLSLLCIVLLLFRRKISLITAVSLVFAGILIASCSLVSESQPRYALPLWLVAAFTVADGISRRFRNDHSESKNKYDLQLYPSSNLPNIIAFVPTAIFTFVGLLLFMMMIRGYYSNSEGRIISKWKLGVTNTFKTDIKQTNKLRQLQNKPTDSLFAYGINLANEPNFNMLSFNLQFPTPSIDNYTINAKHLVCLKNKKTFAFYLSTSDRTLSHKGNSELTLWQDGKLIWSTLLPIAKTPTPVSVLLAKASKCSQLEFKLVTHVKLTNAKMLDESRTEIIFPRLIG